MNKRPEMPANLPPLPEGQVYLGKGDTFALTGEFEGGLLNPEDTRGWDMQGPWEGNQPDYHYCAPTDSEIVKLNGWDTPDWLTTLNADLTAKGLPPAPELPEGYDRLVIVERAEDNDVRRRGVFFYSYPHDDPNPWKETGNNAGGGSSIVHLEAIKDDAEKAPIFGSGTIVDLRNLDPKGAEGAKKTPMQLLPPIALEQMAKVLGTGAVKYGTYNWRTSDGVEIETYRGAILRHQNAYASGEDLDPESGLPHLAHIMASCAILLDAEKVGKLVDNRPGTLVKGGVA